MKKEAAELSWRSPVNFHKIAAQKLSDILSVSPLRILLIVAQSGQKDSEFTATELRVENSDYLL